MTDRSWSWRHAVLKSDLPPTTRHVLLTISCFMNDVGTGCYPTQEQLAIASGLTDRAVRKHIDAAVEAGWLSKREHGFRGQKWRNHEYEAAWPAQHADDANQHVDGGEEPRSAPLGEAEEPRSGKVRNHVPTILPEHPSTSLRSEAPARVSNDDLWAAFPHRPMDNRSRFDAAIVEFTDAETVRVFVAVKRYARWHVEDAEGRGVPPDAQLEYRPAQARWITTGAWIDALTVTLKADPVPATAEGLVSLPPDHPDFKAVEMMLGKKLFVGDSGKRTFRIEEIEQARKTAA